MLRRAQLVYLVGESCAGFRRRKLTTGVTILIMSAALLILALTTVVTLNLGRFLEQAKSGIDVRVFLADGDEDPSQLQPRLLAIPGVADVAFVTSEQALAEFGAHLGEDADVLYLLDEKPAAGVLPAHPDRRGAESGQRPGHRRGDPYPARGGPRSVYHNDWITTLQRWTFRFQLASLIVCLLVFLAAVFVISNTVKLTMAASARSIEIQKLVGATNSFIRTPYLLEGDDSRLAGRCAGHGRAVRGQSRPGRTYRRTGLLLRGADGRFRHLLRRAGDAGQLRRHAQVSAAGGHPVIGGRQHEHDRRPAILQAMRPGAGLGAGLLGGLLICLLTAAGLAQVLPEAATTGSSGQLGVDTKLQAAIDENTAELSQLKEELAAAQRRLEQLDDREGRGQA